MGNFWGYLGTATGLIGAVGSVWAGVVASKANRLAKQGKRLDIRSDIEEKLTHLDHTIRRAKDTMLKADRSHSSLLAAAGRYQSGERLRWEEQRRRDEEKINQLGQLSPNLRDGLDRLDNAGLVNRLSEARKIDLEAQEILDKYLYSIQSDDLSRSRLPRAG